MKKPISKLPLELTSLVNESLDLLGQAARLEFGDSVFNEIESVRKIYKAQRLSLLKKSASAR